MPELANPRHEAFAVMIAQARGPTVDCYIKAGYKAKPGKSAENAASKLLGNVGIQNRIAELRAPAIAAAGIDTTKIVRRMISLAYGDLRKCMRWSPRGIVVKNSKDLTEEQAMMVSEVKKLPDGTVVVKLHKPDGALRMLAQHFGMLQGEVAESTVIDQSTHTTVFVDAPRNETEEEWQARVAKKRGMKLIEGKVEP